MNILFIHQNFPGQFGRLAAHLATDSANTVVTLGEQREGKRFRVPGVADYWYAEPKGAGQKTHHYLRQLEAHVRRGQAVYRALVALRDKGFTPDIIYVHPGWGESLYVKDVFPRARLLCYYEFFYRCEGQDLGFDPEFPVTDDDIPRVRTQNSTHMLSLESCDWGVTPTSWQHKQFPPFFKSILDVVHDGIDTAMASPDVNATYTPQGLDTPLSGKDEVLTYCARNLEPHRGFHIFMRALPEILDARPRCRVLIVGADGVSYGKTPDKGRTYKDLYLAELEKELSPFMDRIHFLGRIPYPDFLRVMQISSAHIYLTYPFVLSWSCLEAMSTGGLLIGSDTPPVREVIKHEVNGLLTDFFDIQALAATTIEALRHGKDLSPLRIAARATIQTRFDFQTVCLPEQLRVLHSTHLS